MPLKLFSLFGPNLLPFPSAIYSSQIHLSISSTATQPDLCFEQITAAHMITGVYIHKNYVSYIVCHLVTFHNSVPKV